ncbi:WRKY transcription factor SUSIBA2 [Bienertia sinuspersici]
MEDTKDGLRLGEWKNPVISPKGSFWSFERGVDNSLRVDMGDNGSNSSKFSSVVDNCDLIKSGMSIAERRAIKCGFNASKISTPHSMFCSPLPSLSGCSPCVTPSQGISPHSIESPILLPNSQLSPTTGTLASHPYDDNSQTLVSTSPVDAEKGSDDGGYSAMFKPHIGNTLPYFRNVDTQVPCTGDLAQNLVTNNEYQSLPAEHSQLDYDFPACCCKVGMEIDHTEAPPDEKISNVANSSLPIVACHEMTHDDGPTMRDDSGIHDSSNVDQNRVYPQTGPVRTGEDGYNWRKYGQKQVKGSEYPRSYYKCTHPSCQVKKKVERSPDGDITEIIYKGAHDHPKPQPCRKITSGLLLPFNETSEISDNSDSCMKTNNALAWRSMQSGVQDVIASNWSINGLGRTSAESAVTELSDLRSTTPRKPMGVLESAGTLEFSKKDGCYPETTLGSRAIREPRVVIQIETEVDILDDGYRWRKYGQKVVKGNPNPRSYYKCTAPGCTVRKHVERSAESKKFVLMTYEGKHNHEVPVARNSSHANSSSGLPAAATNTQTPRNYHLPKPEPCTTNYPLHFDKCDNDFLRPNFLVPPIPPLLFPLPPRFPRPIDSYCSTEMSHSPAQSLYAGQQLQQSNARLLTPKQEQRDESFFESESHSIDRTDASSSAYNHSTVLICIEVAIFVARQMMELSSR